MKTENKEYLDAQTRMAINDCFNLMWDIFSRSVPAERQDSIERFLQVKELGMELLIEDVPQDNL